tara:strand:- start:32108 stop:32227 length:120 start_codon:yes stop_codon:yes gene_type:complete
MKISSDPFVDAMGAVNMGSEEGFLLTPSSTPTSEFENGV